MEQLYSNRHWKKREELWTHVVMTAIAQGHTPMTAISNADEIVDSYVKRTAASNSLPLRVLTAIKNRIFK